MTPKHISKRTLYPTRLTLSPVIAALFTVVRNGENPDVYQLMNGQQKCAVFTQWNATQLLRKNYELSGKRLEMSTVILSKVT